MYNLGLSEEVLDSMIAVFMRNPKITAATVFGSRAKGNLKPFSDVDIAVHGECDVLDVEDTAQHLDELPVVFTFDVVAYESIKSSDLKNHIDRVGVVIYNKADT